VIDVRLIRPNAAPSDAVEIEAAVPPQVIEKPAPIVPSIPEAAPLPKAKHSESGSSLSAFPAEANGKDYVPSQWALEPPLSDENLKGLGLLADVGINSDGRYEVVRVCPQSLPAARDKKYHIPPKGK